jgi:hypothetical protein
MMNFTYLTDESEKSLAPFLAKVTLSALWRGVLIVAGVFLIFNPWQDLRSFFTQQKVPLLSFELFTATLIINAYINLRCGRGEMVERRYLHPDRSKHEIAAFEKEQNFFLYSLIEFVLHTLFLMCPFLPFLIVAASFSGVSLTIFAKASSVVFTASFLCRIMGFLIYLFRGRLSAFGHVLARLFWSIFLFVTILAAPSINPILILYDLNSGSRRITTTLQDMGLVGRNAYHTYLLTMLAAMLFLVIITQLLVRHASKKES